jgi:hypothetical protein
LAEANMLAHYYYAVFKVVESESDNNQLVYDKNYDEVHLDEKWFFLTKQSRTIYLTEDEDARILKTRHKNHILKVMFLCAAARPRFDREGNCTFDGKIGIYPFVEAVQAKRNSENRQKGTREWKPITVKYEVYLDFVLDKVIPDIILKWPRDQSQITTIATQHDNAPAHFGKDEPHFLAATSIDPEWAFDLNEQPANSPDMKILDLGFFSSFQSFQWTFELLPSIEGQMDTMDLAFRENPSIILNRVWITHQTVMDMIITDRGDSSFKLIHMGKEALENKLIFEPTIPVSDDALFLLRSITRRQYSTREVR